MKKKGFTLIELLIVVAVIGILASVILVSLGKAREKAHTARLASELGQIEKAFIITYLDEDRDDWWTEAELGLGPNPTINDIIAKTTGPLSGLSKNLPSTNFSDLLTAGNYQLDSDGDINFSCDLWNGVNLGIATASLEQQKALDLYIDGEDNPGCGKIRYTTTGRFSGWLLYQISADRSF